MEKNHFVKTSKFGFFENNLFRKIKILRILPASISKKICGHTSYVVDVRIKCHGVMSTPWGPKNHYVYKKNTNFGNLKHVEWFSMFLAR